MTHINLKIRDVLTEARLSGKDPVLDKPQLEYLEELLGFLESVEYKTQLRFNTKPGWVWDMRRLGEARLEKISDSAARFVVDMPLHVAESMRNKFSLPILPAAIDATEAIVRATHALAGAAIELGSIAKKLNDKL